MRSALVTVFSLSAMACAHVVTNEERVEMAIAPQAESADADALRCRDTSPEIQIARDVKTPKAERLTRYQSVVAQMKATQGRFDEEFRKDPDLVYGPKAEEWQHRKQICSDLVTALERERQQVGTEAGDAPAAAADAAPAAPTPVAETPAADDSKAKKTPKLSKAQKAKLAKAKKHGRNAQLARADE